MITANTYLFNVFSKRLAYENKMLYLETQLLIYTLTFILRRKEHFLRLPYVSSIFECGFFHKLWECRAQWEVSEEITKFVLNNFILHKRIYIQWYSRYTILQKYAHIFKIKVEVQTNSIVLCLNAYICFHRWVFYYIYQIQDTSLSNIIWDMNAVIDVLRITMI